MTKPLLFKKYESIGTNRRQKTIDHIIQSGFSCEWVSTLKIHGANYSFWYNGTELKTASRSGFIRDCENFYGDNNFNYDSNVKAMYEWLKARHDFTTITVFGEIYGGVYNHVDVAVNTSAVKVQKEVQYRPDNDFIVFDIKCDDEYIGWDLLREVCLVSGFSHVPELGRGAFADLLNLPVNFADPLHKELGLPTIDNNLAEGWVLKPLEKALFFNSGDRVIVKGKSDKMQEKSKPAKPSGDILLLSAEGKNLCVQLLSYLTESRLKNVISHGAFEVTQKCFGRLTGAFSQDAFQDFLKDFEDVFNMLEKKEQSAIKKTMNNEAGNIIRPNFVNIIDGLY